MNNHGQTRTGFTSARLARLAMCVILALNSAVVGAKNLYNDWAQENAVNLNTEKPQNTTSQNPSAPMLQQIMQGAQTCKDEWSGSLNDLKALVDRAKQKYGFENTKHQGRNATMLIPANQREMNRILESGDVSTGSWLKGNVFNRDSWPALGTGYHANNAERTDGAFQAIKNTIGSGVNKYIVRNGDFRGAEVVYDKRTGKIVKNWRMGTRNFAYVTDPEGDHGELDVDTHRRNSQYKYVGILFETDPSDPNKYYIVNGQTGKRMTWREAEDFPTTLSDEWKEMGLVCVAEDATDMIEPDQCRDEAKCDIDTSKLESLLKDRIEMLEQFIAKVGNGKQLDEHDKSRYEGNVNETISELQRIDKQIMSLDVPDDKRREIGVRTIGKVKSLLDKVVGLEAELEKLAKKSDDVTCQCANPRPYAFNGQSSIPGWANCENCGRQVGVTLNGKIISNNPLTKGKEPRWVTWEEAKKISERFKKK